MKIGRRVLCAMYSATVRDGTVWDDDESTRLFLWRICDECKDFFFIRNSMRAPAFAMFWASGSSR